MFKGFLILCVIGTCLYIPELWLPLIVIIVLLQQES